MLVLAVLLIAASAAALVVIALQATEPVTVTMLGSSLETTSREVFLAGTALGLVLAVALWLLKSSSARSRRRRAEVRDLKKTRRSEVARLEAEKAELENALHERRTAPTAAPSGTPAPTASAAPAGPAAPEGAPADHGAGRHRDGARTVDVAAAERRRESAAVDETRYEKRT